jgi:hypothetical protein
LLLYGLMLHWGYNLIVRKPDPPAVHGEPQQDETKANGSTVSSHPTDVAGEGGAGLVHVQSAPADQGRPLTALEKATAASRSLYSATVMIQPKKGD